jgi:UDP-N-acetyl-D-galactosamine dehydrogenase
MGWDELLRADAVVAAVTHRRLRTLGADDLARKLVKGGCVIDVRSAFGSSALAAAGLRVWRL